MNIKAVVVAFLVFVGFWYVSTLVADYSVGFELPFFGYIDLTHPLASLAQPLQILGGLVALVTFIIMSRKKAT